MRAALAGGPMMSLPLIVPLLTHPTTQSSRRWRARWSVFSRRCGATLERVHVAHHRRVVQVHREADGGWVLVHYADASANQPNSIAYLASGEGGVGELTKLRAMAALGACVPLVLTHARTRAHAGI